MSVHVRGSVPAMLHVRTMSERDFAFAVRLTDEMDWDFSEADFRFMTELEPHGCFVLLRGAQRIGIATTVSYGQVGWFGNLIVAPDSRQSGGGTLLVTHALKYLADKGVKTVGLYAYMERVPFYTALGFKYDSDFILLKGVAPASSGPSPTVREAKNHEVDQIIRVDRACLGEPRRRLLEPLLHDPDSHCHVHVENDTVSGFVLARVYDGYAWLGPLVCAGERSDVAADLLAAALNKLTGVDVSMCIPANKAAALGPLTKQGFREHVRVARMFLGPAVVGGCLFAAESLERG